MGNGDVESICATRIQVSSHFCGCLDDVNQPQADLANARIAEAGLSERHRVLVQSKLVLDE